MLIFTPSSNNLQEKVNLLLALSWVGLGPGKKVDVMFKQSINREYIMILDIKTHQICVQFVSRIPVTKIDRLI